MKKVEELEENVASLTEDVEKLTEAKVELEQQVESSNEELAKLEKEKVLHEKVKALSPNCDSTRPLFKSRAFAGSNTERLRHFGSNLVKFVCRPLNKQIGLQQIYYTGYCCLTGSFEESCRFG